MAKQKPDYGGAFDIDPSSFWCREDLDEFQSELEDRKFIKKNKIIIRRGYIELDEDNKNIMEFDFVYQDCEFTVKQKIDMRRIQKPSDLRTKYIPVIETQILKAIMS